MQSEALRFSERSSNQTESVPGTNQRTPPIGARHEFPPGKVSPQMWGLIAAIAFVVVWFVLMKFVLPRFGVPT